MPKVSVKTILVIDDTADALKILKRYLERWGYRTLLTGHEDEGLVLAESKHPDLILLDMLMPQKSGDEVYSLLKANPKTRDIPVIFLSALGIPDRARTGMGMGGEDYVVKPFDPDELQRHIHACLLRHHGEPSA